MNNFPLCLSMKSFDIIKNKIELEEAEYKELLSAVESGDNKAKTKLAYYKLSGCGDAEVDKDGAVLLLLECVKDKDLEAMWMLGICYEYGIGCEQNVEEAERLYKECWDGGNLIGKFIFENGKDKRGSGIMIVPKGLC